MDKEREIDGIVEAMYAICDDCNDCPYEKYGYLACEEHQKAKRIYEAGYRKLADDDIVLTKAMQDGSCDGMDDRTLKFFKKHNAAVRNETAKEILNNLYCYPHEYHEKRILELAKKYGVEVDE